MGAPPADPEAARRRGGGAGSVRNGGGGVLGADLGSSSGGGEDVSGARTPPHPASPPPDENDRATAAAVLTAAMEPKPGPRRLLQPISLRRTAEKKEQLQPSPLNSMHPCSTRLRGGVTVQHAVASPYPFADVWPDIYQVCFFMFRIQGAGQIFLPACGYRPSNHANHIPDIASVQAISNVICCPSV